MKKLPISEIQDGMVLAQPVNGANGNVLLGKGSSLKASMANRLSAWGVSSVCVESSDDPDSTATPSTANGSVRERIDHMFEGRLVNSAMRTIHRATLSFHGLDDGTT